MGKNSTIMVQKMNKKEGIVHIKSALSGDIKPFLDLSATISCELLGHTYEPSLMFYFVICKVIKVIAYSSDCCGETSNV